MKYLILASVLMILSIFCQASSLLASQCQNYHLAAMGGLKDEIKEEREIENDEVHELDELEELEEIVENTEIDDIKEEIIEEVEITKFRIDGLMLREGIISEEVLRLKKFFIAKGYEGLSEDYFFDQRTKEIVMDYQRENGLVPDGIVGIKTFIRINEDMEENKILILAKELIFSMDNCQENIDVPEGNFIVINKDNNTLYHLYNREVVKTYPVATGKNPKYTPEGKFIIVTKFINPAWGGAGRYKPIRGGAPNNPLGRRWMGLNIGGGGVYGIHGNSDKNSIGRYISLGCIRMFNEDVEELYDLIDLGTPVWIGTEEKLKEFGIIFGYNTVTNIDSDG